MNSQEIRSIQSDHKFRIYVEKHLERGDKRTLCALLCMSYPTLRLHLAGLLVNPATQAQIIEFFERRKRARSRAQTFVYNRINELNIDDAPVFQAPTLQQFLTGFNEDPEPTSNQ